MGEMDHRLESLCRVRGVDGVVLRRRSNMAWATGGADLHCDTATSLGVAALLWTPRRRVVLTDCIEAARLREEEPLEGWDVLAAPWWEADAEMAAAEAGVREGRYLCDWPQDCLQECRASLSGTEIERVRTLAREAAEVIEKLLREDAKPGMTERHLGGAAAGWLRDRGILAHVVLVAADERIRRYRHPIPTGRAIEQCAMIAVCAQRHGLIVSLTRLVHFGPLSADLAHRHVAVCAVDRALIGATRPGTRWCDALAAGVAEYERQGFGEEWKLHHQGGPTGYEPRDFKATPSETREVQPDQLVAWNPSITGTKSEDTILARAGGAPEVLTDTGSWPRKGGRAEILVRGLD